MTIVSRPTGLLWRLSQEHLEQNPNKRITYQRKFYTYSELKGILLLTPHYAEKQTSTKTFSLGPLLSCPSSQSRCIDLGT